MTNHTCLDYAKRETSGNPSSPPHVAMTRMSWFFEYPAFSAGFSMTRMSWFSETHGF